MFRTFILCLGCLVAGTQGAWAADAQALDAQANAFYSQRNYPAAYQSYRQACVLDPANGPAWWGLANTLYLLGHKADALGAYQRAARLLPNYAPAQERYRQVEAELHPGEPVT